MHAVFGDNGDSAVLAVMLSLMTTPAILTHRHSRVLVDLDYIARIKLAAQEFFRCTTDDTGRISCLPHFRLLVRCCLEGFF